MTTPAAPIPTPDADERKGAVEQDSRDHATNTSMNGQMQHRNPSPLANSSDSDFPEPGGNPEHTGQEGGANGRDARNQNPGSQPQDPDERQKRNEGDKKDDSAAA